MCPLFKLVHVPLHHSSLLLCQPHHSSANGVISKFAEGTLDPISYAIEKDIEELKSTSPKTDYYGIPLVSSLHLDTAVDCKHSEFTCVFLILNFQNIFFMVQRLYQGRESKLVIFNDQQSRWLVKKYYKLEGIGQRQTLFFFK